MKFSLKHYRLWPPLVYKALFLKCLEENRWKSTIRNGFGSRIALGGCKRFTPKFKNTKEI
jgi:hypothetical protein